MRHLGKLVQMTKGPEEQLRSLGDRPRGSQVMLVRERLVPVQAGLVFEADGLSTDLSLTRLVDGPALRQRLTEAMAPMPQVVDDLMAHTQRLTVPSVPREWSLAPGRFGLSMLAWEAWPW